MKTSVHAPSQISVRWLLALFILLFALQTTETLAASRAPASGGGGGRSNRFGAGLMIGTIDAITGKYILSNSGAVDFGLAFFGTPWTMLYADYLWLFPGMFGGGSPFARQLTGYLGAGGGIGFWSRRSECYRYYCGTAYSDTATGLFLRAFFGAEWYPGHPPLGIFAEIGPSIGVMPGFGGVLDLGIGLRYFF